MATVGIKGVKFILTCYRCILSVQCYVW